MSKSRTVGVAIAAIVCFSAGAVVASAGGSSGSNGGAGRDPSGVGPVVANAKHARAAAVVDTAPSFVAVKGFDRVTRPAVGQYCLRLEDRDLRATRLVPQATVEWGSSSGNDLMVQWYRAAGDCPNSSRFIEIMTFDEAVAGTWDFSNDVAFNVVVP